MQEVIIAKIVDDVKEILRQIYVSQKRQLIKMASFMSKE